MPTRDRLLAALVAVLWGLNFPAIHLSLEQFPPFFLVALRFALLAVPTLLLVPRPSAPLALDRCCTASGSASCSSCSSTWRCRSGMPTGLASLVLQSSAPFTVVLAGVFLRERIDRAAGAGILLAVAGLAGIAAHRAGLAGGATLVPVLLTLCGGLGWAIGNLGNRRAMQAQPGRAAPAAAVDVRRAAAAAAGAVAGRRGSGGRSPGRSRAWTARRGCSRSPGWPSRSSSRRSSAPGCGPR